MENKILAIKGHSTRGKEVIEILEMLGGINNLLEGKDTHCFYYIHADNNHIILGHAEFCNTKDFIIFTLEEFLEKYPYKVGDKVKYKNSPTSDFISLVNKMIWDNNQIKYNIYNPCCDIFKVTAEDLQPHKEEIKAEDHTNIHINPDIDNKTTCDIKINGMKVNINDYTVKSITKTDDGLIVEYIKNKPQYPKTFQECYALKYNGQINLNIGCDILHGAYSEQLECLQNLLICRDIYWEIAGVEMGLSEPWKPSANDEGKTHSLYYNRYTDSIDKCEGLFESNAILDFPTKEMRDAFFENFKDLIEKCKEFL